MNYWKVTNKWPTITYISILLCNLNILYSELYNIWMALEGSPETAVKFICISIIKVQNLKDLRSSSLAPDSKSWLLGFKLYSYRWNGRNIRGLAGFQPQYYFNLEFLSEFWMQLSLYFHFQTANWNKCNSWISSNESHEKRPYNRTKTSIVRIRDSAKTFLCRIKSIHWNSSM